MTSARHLLLGAMLLVKRHPVLTFAIGQTRSGARSPLVVKKRRSMFSANLGGGLSNPGPSGESLSSGAESDEGLSPSMMRRPARARDMLSKALSSARYTVVLCMEQKLREISFLFLSPTYILRMEELARNLGKRQRKGLRPTADWCTTIMFLCAHHLSRP
jgi:hypothetical protein